MTRWQGPELVQTQWDHHTGGPPAVNVSQTVLVGQLGRRLPSSRLAQRAAGYLAFLRGHSGVWGREDAGLDSGDTLTPLLFHSWNPERAVTQCTGREGGEHPTFLLTCMPNVPSQDCAQ